MKSLLSSLVRSRSNWPIVGLVFAASALLLGMVLLLHFWKGIPVGHLTADPGSILGSPPYLGFLSQMGIFFWSGTAAVCLFGVAVLPECPEHLGSRRFLLASGLLTLLLGFDDVFLLHEGVLPRMGIPEKAVLATYGGLLLAYLLGFYASIMKTDYLLLTMALAFFGLSVGLDVIVTHQDGLYLFEDGFKLAGQLSWLGYFFRTGASAVLRCR